jgi:hypothetical protein
LGEGQARFGRRGPPARTTGTPPGRLPAWQKASCLGLVQVATEGRQYSLRQSGSRPYDSGLTVLDRLSHLQGRWDGSPRHRPHRLQALPLSEAGIHRLPPRLASDRLASRNLEQGGNCAMLSGGAGGTNAKQSSGHGTPTFTRPGQACTVAGSLGWSPSWLGGRVYLSVENI